MSKRSELYYKECRENSTGKYYKKYAKKMQERVILFEENYKDMEFFRKHIPKNIPFSQSKHISLMQNILRGVINKEVYIIKADGHIQKARISKVMDSHYTRKIFDVKRGEYILINHQLRKVLGIYDTKGNVLWEYLDWGNPNQESIDLNKRKLFELTNTNQRKRY